MTDDKVTIDGCSFVRGAEPGTIRRGNHHGSGERYRRANNHHGYEFFYTLNREWCEGNSEGEAKEMILKALDTLLPRKAGPSIIEPFGEYGWVSAGEGCVRATRHKTYYARYRRGANGAVEGQSQHGARLWRTVCDGPVSDGARKALDHFWPLTKPAFRADRWRKGRRPNLVEFYDSKIGWSSQLIKGGPITNQSPSGNNFTETELRAAFAHFWPDAASNTVEMRAATNLIAGQTVTSLDVGPVRNTDTIHEKTMEQPIAWTFKATPEAIDLPRILREAYASGAREVTVERDGVSTTYLHHEARNTVRLYNQSGRRGCLAGFFRATTVSGWEVLKQPCLAAARTWAAEQERKAKVAARKVVVKVTGVR